MTLRPIGTRILIVDDDELSRDLLTVLLEGEGYVVSLAESGDAALIVLEANRQSPPDAVLTDLQMPGITGAELATRMRAICNTGTRLLAMSGSRPRPQALLGFHGFLLKPFAMEELASAIHTPGPPAPASSKPQEIPTEAADTGDRATALDPKTFGELSEMMRPKQMAELYSMGLRDAKAHVSAMRVAAARADATDFKRRAHAMKGSFGMLGARDLQQLASEMETRGLDAADHVTTLENFSLAMDTLRRILRARGLPLGGSGDQGSGTK